MENIVAEAAFQFWLILDNFGQFLAILGNFWQFWSFFGQFLDIFWTFEYCCARLPHQPLFHTVLSILNKYDYENEYENIED